MQACKNDKGLGTFDASIEASRYEHIAHAHTVFSYVQNRVHTRVWKIPQKPTPTQPPKPQKKAASRQTRVRKKKSVCVMLVAEFLEENEEVLKKLPPPPIAVNYY